MTTPKPLYLSLIFTSVIFVACGDSEDKKKLEIPPAFSLGNIDGTYNLTGTACADGTKAVTMQNIVDSTENVLKDTQGLEKKERALTLAIADAKWARAVMDEIPIRETELRASEADQVVELAQANVDNHDEELKSDLKNNSDEDVGSKAAFSIAETFRQSYRIDLNVARWARGSTLASTLKNAPGIAETTHTELLDHEMAASVPLVTWLYQQLRAKAQQKAANLRTSLQVNAFSPEEKESKDLTEEEKQEEYLKAGLTPTEEARKLLDQAAVVVVNTQFEIDGATLWTVYTNTQNNCVQKLPSSIEYDDKRTDTIKIRPSIELFAICSDECNEDEQEACLDHNAAMKDLSEKYERQKLTQEEIDASFVRTTFRVSKDSTTEKQIILTRLTNHLKEPATVSKTKELRMDVNGADSMCDVNADVGFTFMDVTPSANSKEEEKVVADNK